MSSFIYPGANLLLGVTYNVKRTSQFQTRVQTAVSGMETRIADWSMPRTTYELEYEFLRSDATFKELQLLGAFYLNRLGSFDSFLFLDVDDSIAIGSPLGTGDGTTTRFQLIRGFGKVGAPLWYDPIYAPVAVTAVYFDTVLQDPAGYSINYWESTAPGTIDFTVAPGAGVAVTADFTYCWPCRFTDDTLDLAKFMQTLWLAKKVSFITIKAG